MDPLPADIEFSIYQWSKQNKRFIFLFDILKIVAFIEN
jgi:hypothetical protein